MFDPHILQLAEKVVQTAKARSKSICTAESCTGGLISAAITAIPGSSEVFHSTLVTYSNVAKHKILNVSADTLQRYGAVSRKAAIEMSMGARETVGADICVSVTGVAGPSGGTLEKPVGLVHFGLVTAEDTEHHKQVFKGDRHEIRMQTVQQALMMIHEHLEKDHVA